MCKGKTVLWDFLVIFLLKGSSRFVQSAAVILNFHYWNYKITRCSFTECRFRIQAKHTQMKTLTRLIKSYNNATM